MPLHDDTPPNGDYAAYIEKLMQRSQAGTPGLAAGDAGKARKPAGIRALQDAAQKALQEAKRKAAQSSASAAPASGTQKNAGTASARPAMTAPAAGSAPASPRFDSAWQAQKPASMNATVGSPASYGNIRADAAAASSPPRSSNASTSQGHNQGPSQSNNQGDNQSDNQSQGSKKRSYLPLILAVLFLMPLLNIARDMLNNPRPEGLFLVIVAVFVIFSIRHSIKSGNEPDKGKRRPAIKKDDDYPNTGQ